MVFVGSVLFALKMWQNPDKITLMILFTALPMAIFLATILIGKSIPRTSALLWPVTLPIVIAAIGLINEYQNQNLHGEALIISVIFILFYLLYIFWYSNMPSRIKNRLQIGKKLPCFTVKTANENKINSDEIEHKKAIWIFYRGNWCPLCMAQIKEVAQQYQQLSAMGATINLVSPQPVKFTQELSKKFSVPFNFYIDEANQAASLLGIAMPKSLPFGMEILGYNTDSVLPTVIITNEEGKVIWVHQTDNYRVRPEPDVFLDVFQKHERGERVEQPNEVSAYWNGELIARSSETVVVEGNYYFPRKDVKEQFLETSATTSVCPWKGLAHYHHIHVNQEVNKDAAWYYPTPSPLANKIKDHIAFWKGVKVES